jgi:enamine deaminase RidA (YjgF/YER057c/UK114 family)
MQQRQRVSSGSPYEPTIGFCRAIRVRTRVYLTDLTDADALGAVHGQLFTDARPAATMVVVAGLLAPRWKVEIEAEAAHAEEPSA